MSDTMPSVVTAQPARLLVGDREVTVVAHPLSQVSESRRSVELDTDNPDCYVVSPVPDSQIKNVVEWCVAAGMLGVGGWIVVWAVRLISDLQLSGIMIGIGLLICGLIPVGFGCLFVHSLVCGQRASQFHFDRGSKRLLIGCRRGSGKQFQIKSSRDLTDVLAVQLLYGGYHRVSHTSDNGPTTNEQYYAYEMNLIVDDAEQPRMHVCSHADWEWTRDVGNTIAAFLQVPVVDQLRHGD